MSRFSSDPMTRIGEIIGEIISVAVLALMVADLGMMFA
jgi:hypothetical protein